MRKAMVAIVLAVTATMMAGCNRTQSHDPASYDGRYHKCGLVTEQGVTDHLDAYTERCGVQAP